MNLMICFKIFIDNINILIVLIQIYKIFVKQFQITIFHTILIIFQHGFKININIHGNIIEIVDTQDQFFNIIDQQLKQLKQDDYISLWPDQLGRQIINHLVNNYNKRINIVLQGTYSKINQQVLNNFTKNSKLINIIQYEQFQTLNQKIQISFITPRVNQLNCGLLVNSSENVLFSQQSLDSELAINYGSDTPSAYLTDLTYNTYNTTIVTTHDIIKTVEITQFIQDTNNLFILFKGSHMKETTKLILEERKGLVSQIISHFATNQQKYRKIKILANFEASKFLKEIQSPWTQQNFQWEQNTNFNAIKRCFCQISLKTGKFIENVNFNDFTSFICQKNQKANEYKFQQILNFVQCCDIYRYNEHTEHYMLYNNHIQPNKQQQNTCWQFLCDSDEILNSLLQSENFNVLSPQTPYQPSQHLYKHHYHQQPHQQRPVKKNIKICFFSPHPDDDVVSAGGIQSQLIKQTLNNEFNDFNVTLHMCYCVTGAVAVSDQSLVQFMDRFNQNCIKYDVSDEILQNMQTYNASSFITKYICSQQEFDPKSKALLRELEAMSALDILNFFDNSDNTVNFLRLPFYGSGFGQRKTPENEDIDIVVNILQKYQPDAILLAGDLNDPHGTHSICYEIIKSACKIYEEKYRILQPLQHNIYKSIFNFDCTNISLEEIKDLIINKNVLIKFLYRGAWDDFLPDEATFIYIMDKKQMNKKIIAANQHESQMGQALYLANDKRSFDVRVIQRNQYTAEFIKNIGIIKSQQKMYAECLVACEQLP